MKRAERDGAGAGADLLKSAGQDEVLDLVLADETNTWQLGSDRRWRRVENVHGLSAQGRLKALAIERARRRRESDLFGGDEERVDG